MRKNRLVSATDRQHSTTDTDDAASVPAETMGVNNSFTAVAYHHTDALGSVRATSDYDGHVLESFGFAPDGQASAIPTSTPFGFAGMLLDAETHLYYDNARYYSPSQGRFLSPDPIGSKGGVNIYEYVGGDPLNGLDLTGLFRPTGLEVYCEDCIAHVSFGERQQAGEGEGGTSEVDDANGNFVSYVRYGANSSTYFTDQAGNTQHFTSGPDGSITSLGSSSAPSAQGTTSNGETPFGLSNDPVDPSVEDRLLNSGTPSNPNYNANIALDSDVVPSLAAIANNPVVAAAMQSAWNASIAGLMPVEHGFAIGQANNGAIFITPTVEGEGASVNIPVIPPSEGVTLADFHTHPNDPAISPIPGFGWQTSPSPTDIAVANTTNTPAVIAPYRGIYYYAPHR